jgi:site-specific DNA-methyltransferase (adenine-specific)
MWGHMSTWRVMVGDCRESMRTLPDASVQCVVTSPPYFWARDYSHADQLGHEATTSDFVVALVDVFRDVRRVLRDDGVLWLNLGDSIYSGNGQPHGSDPRSPSRDFMRRKLRPLDVGGWHIPKKSLLGIPWKVAHALQEDGWTLRSDIIWNRVNAFCEPSVTDRPQRQHEHVFLLSKARRYYFDVAALPEPADIWTIPADNVKGFSAAFPPELARRCILAGSRPGDTVLDPFGGSGTTGMVATGHGRHAILCELNPEYVPLIRERCGPMLEGAA